MITTIQRLLYGDVYASKDVSLVLDQNLISAVVVAIISHQIFL